MRNPDRQTVFRFKQFEVSNCQSAMKIGTDGVLLGAWAFEGYEPVEMRNGLRILDVGCGTGLLSLMMAQRFGNARITGVDIEQVACREAAANFRNSDWRGRLDAQCCDFADFVYESQPSSFDLIICNPPFFTNGALSPDNSRRAARHEGNLNLDLLIAASARLLADNGRLALVSAAEHRSRIEFLATVNRMEIVRLCMVKTVGGKLPRRVLCEMIKSQTSAQSRRLAESELEIRRNDGTYSQEYISLVEPYYIKI